MGNRSSRPVFLTYEDALRKLTSEETRRIEASFKLLCSSEGYLTVHVFSQYVLSPHVPQFVLKSFYSAFCGNASRGLNLKELTVALVLLTKSSRNDRLKFLFDYFSEDSETVQTVRILNVQRESGENVQQVLLSAVANIETLNGLQEFATFVEQIKSSSSVCKWILDQPNQLTCLEPFTGLHQLLAGLTHLNEREVSEVEQHWTKLVNDPICKITKDRLQYLVSPPVPIDILSGLFCALDDNNDGYIDFKELVCGLSACCRGPRVERYKFVFKVFDEDRDGCLMEEDIKRLLHVLLTLNYDTLDYDDMSCLDSDALYKEIISTGDMQKTGKLTMADFIMWANERPAVDQLADLLFQVCHIVLGLKPDNKETERKIVSKWMEREKRMKLEAGQTWYLVSTVWWNNYEQYINITTPLSSRSCTPLSNGRIRGDSVIAFSNDIPDSVTISTVKSLDDEKIRREVQATPVFSTHSRSDSDIVTPPTSPSMSRYGGASSSASSEISDREMSPMRQPRRNWSPCPRIKQISPDRTAIKVTRPGPIDNSPLIDKNAANKKLRSLTEEGGELRQGLLIEESHFKLLGPHLFMALQRWYGGANPVLPRKVIMNERTKLCELELYPISLTILRHVTAGQRSNSANANAALSWSSAAMSMARGAQEVARQTLTELQHSAVSQAPRRVPMYTVSFATNTNIAQLVTFLCKQLALTNDNMRLWLLFGANQCEKMCLEEENSTLAELALDTNDSQVLLEVRNKDLTWPEEILDVAKTGQVNDNKSHQSGVTGLSNMGNTCYMNSALQCVSNTVPLTTYFTKGIYNLELNRNNRDGSKGQLALAYSRLIKDLWSGSSRVVAPIKFKMTLCKLTDQFPELRQHDCQELLGFLLDGLHEDLNRVKEKPYRQLKDSNGRPDEVVAAEAWDNHVRRNKSVIVDLFHGLLKSEVTCKECNNSSVKFDPFTFLSLPIPYENLLLFYVTVISLDGSFPIKYGIRLSADSALLKLREEVAKLCNIPCNNLLMVELDSNGRFVNVPSLHEKLRRLGVNNVQTQMFAMQIPPPIEEPSPPIVSPSPTPFSRSHSRNESSASSVSSSRSVTVPPPRVVPPTLGNMAGYTFAVHRRMDCHSTYMLAHHRTTPIVFGLPIVVPAENSPHLWKAPQMYKCVLHQIQRLLSPPAVNANNNHALDGDASNPSQTIYPFRLKITDETGRRCCVCPWFKFCTGCPVLLDDMNFDMPDGCILVIDWDMTALHLRYQHNLEKHTIEHETVAQATKDQHQPISLDSCLQAFTRPEELTDKDTYYCSKCKQHRPAIKKLDIWKLPPILVVHFKRFQQLPSGAWVKSCKYVTFPKEKFDPTTYLACNNATEMTSFRNDVENDIPAESSCVVGETERISNDNQPLCDENYTNISHVHKSNHVGNGILPHRIRSESSGSTLTPMVEPNDHKLIEGSDPNNLHYDLYAIACHYGNLGSGHYTTYAKNRNNWYLYNDSRCKKIASDEIDGTVAYLLFYERSGLDYSKYLPDIQPSPGAAGAISDTNPSDESDSETKCSIQ